MVLRAGANSATRRGTAEGSQATIAVMIDDLWLRWLVTALFLVSAAECGIALARGEHRRADLVDQGLHILMAVAMVAMAWPAGAALPTTAPMLIFLAAAVWFGLRTLSVRGGRTVNAYHCVMMLAMVWMYAVMGGGLTPVPADGGTSAVGHAAHHGHAGAAAGMHAHTPPLITGVNWMFTVLFAVAALWWLYRLIVCRRSGGSGWDGAGDAGQAMAAAGMAVMFGVML